MKKFKWIWVGVLVIFVSGNLFAMEAKITGMEGNVMCMKADAQSWENAVEEQSLVNGDKLKSEKDSWAEISFKAGHTAKLGPNSSMVINKISKDTSLELFKGELLSKVKKLSKTESYEVKTPQSVASVKGTEFSVNVGENTKISVFEGSVIAQEIKTGQQVVIPAGSFTVVVENSAPSEPQEIEQPDKTEAPEEKPEPEKEAKEPESEEDKKKEKVRQALRQNIRQEIREAVADIRTDIDTSRDVIDQVKDSDSATGRTLRDVHGNLVRIEQYVLRPEPETLQFVNIAKRSDYKYKGRMEVEDTGARLDKLEATFTFNMGLPDKLSDWFGFFQDIDEQDEDFHPTKIELKDSNGADSIVMTSTWDKDEEDMEEPEVRLISGKSGKEGEWLVDTDTELTEAEEGSGIMWGSEEKFEAWMISPNFRIFKDADNDGEFDSSEENELVRLGQEIWMINNDGDILDPDSFAGVDGSANPFDILRKIAFESSMVCKYAFPDGFLLNDKPDIDEDKLTDAEFDEILSDFNQGKNFFSGNIDLVITPDFAIPILEKIAEGAASSM